MGTEGEEYDNLERKKRRLIHSMTSDKATIVSLLEQTVSNDVINLIAANLDTWARCLDELEQVDEGLMQYIDYSKTGALKEEEKLSADYASFRKELTMYTGKFKTVKDTLLPPPSPAGRGRQSMMNSSFFEAHLINPLIKLQDIPVPEFDGTMEKFLDWFAEFESVVEKNEGLDDFQKLYLLRRCFVGKAKKCLIDFGTKGEYYRPALEYIQRKFNNRRRIIAEHFHQLYHLPVMKAANMRDTLDDVQRILRGLKVCGIQTQAFSPFVTYLVSLKLPDKLRIEWESSQRDFSCYPEFETMYSFLIDKCFAYETAPNRDKDSSSESKPAAGSPTKAKNPTTKSSSVPEKKSFAGVKNQTPKSPNVSAPLPPPCVGCGDCHYLDTCKLFLNKSVNERFEFVKNNRLCIKCFKSNHTVSNCKRFNCRLCNGHHHYLLHREVMIGSNGQASGTSANSSGGQNSQGSGQSGNSNGTGGSNSSSGSGQPHSSLCSLANNKSVFLSTAVVKVQGSAGTELGRILFDQGSEVTVVTREFCQRAKLQILPSKYPSSLIGLNETPVLLNGCVKFVLKSRFSSDSIAIEAEVISKIPYSVNRNSFTKTVSNISLNLAESLELPYYDVDIMLGSEYVEFVFRENRIFYENLCLRDSIFGYVLSGSSRVSSFMTQQFCGLSNVQLSEQFSRFFDHVVEPENNQKEAVYEHKLFNDHFESTYQIDKETNRFLIRLPVKDSINVLNGSFGKVRTMLYNSEKRRKPFHHEIYCKVFQEYENLGHMTRLKGSPNFDAYFIPHHLVFKEKDPDSSRIVFNASFNDNSGTSLNSHLLEGPVLQPDLFTHVVRFRNYPVAFSADIFRMYRSILANPVDRKYQHILFRYDYNQPVEECELNTLVNGVGPASSIATKCLDKVGEFVEKYDQIAAGVIRKHFYMDNGMTGANSVKEAISIQKTIHSALGKYGFNLCKYQSNSEEFLSLLDPKLIEKLKTRILGGVENEFVYLLGLVWTPGSDQLSVVVPKENVPDKVTKRVMLSLTSKLYDILGILSPVSIRAKILLQELWREGRNWDEEVSSELKLEFTNYVLDLAKLANFSIDRCYFSSIFETRDLIGFCDASTKAYCAVVYVRSFDSKGNISVSFVCSKTRIAPKKPVDIHRLELMATELLANLAEKICTILSVKEVYYFSDSQVALCWLKIDPSKLKLFVSNRVSKVTKLTKVDRWYHVEGEQNPADLGTRGLSANAFLSNSMWYEGPSWLKDKNVFDKYVSNVPPMLDNVPEIKIERTSLLVFSYLPVSHIVEKYYSLYKILTVIGYWLRFMRILKGLVDRKRNVNLDIDSSLDKNRKFLSVGERKQAMYAIIRFVQKEKFGIELQCLHNKVEFPRQSRLKSLNVFLDDNGLMRVGGRLENSNLSYDVKYPIILPSSCRFTERYVTFVHEKHAHARRSFLYHHMRSRFWVIGNIFAVFKKVFRFCVPCGKSDGKLGQQFMGNLPKERVSVQRPFSVVGVDLTGAVTIKCTNHRTYKNVKVYLVFFVCFAIRAVHIEIVEDLSTEAFLSVLERFSARRGLPRIVYSDNATNFIGIKNVLLNDPSINRFLGENGIDWRTIAPHSPHQGGLWESAVKAGKSYLIRSIGNQVLNLFELSTVAAKVESILNSRPLCYQRINEFVSPISPGHFLIGTDFLEVPLSEDRLGNVKSRYRLWRQVVDSFWVSWRQNYLNELQVRHKWQSQEKNLEVNDVVLVSDKNVPILRWPMAIVEEVFPDSAGMVRNVVIRMANGSKKKTSVQKLAYLPVNVELN